MSAGTEGGGKQQNTAYGVFVQACWAQHKRQYPDELIHKEIEEFNKQCSVWWYNLSEQERERFQEMADRSNNASGGGSGTTTVVTAQQQQGQQQVTYVNNATVVQNVAVTTSSSSSSSSIPSFGSSFNYADYGISGGSTGGNQVVNAVVDNTGTVINYSTAGGQIIQGTPQHRIVSQRPLVGTKHNVTASTLNQKPMKDPNAPKKPLSAYFLFSQEERLKVKAEYADYSITEVAKELGKRWATIDPAVKLAYEQRYQESRRQYEAAMAAYKPQKKRKDPNAPKQPLSAYFIFSSEERLKVKAEHPSYSICEVAKELGRRWADMAPEIKQRYQQMAEEGRQKYDQDMAAYRQGNYQPPGSTNVVVGGVTTTSGGVTQTVVTTARADGVITGDSPPPTQQENASANTTSQEDAQSPGGGETVVVTTAAVTQAGATSYTGIVAGNDYSSLLQ